MRRLIFLTLLSLLSVPVLAQNNEEAKIKATVEDRYQKWIGAANKKDAAALTDMFDEFAVLMPRADETVIGKAAISEYYKKLVANPNYVPFKLALNSTSFHTVADIAIETTIVEGELTRNDKKIYFRGKEMLVWKKETDGSWKIFRYMFDEIPPKK